MVATDEKQGAIMMLLLFAFLLLAGPVGAETFKPGPDEKCHRYSNVWEPTNGICDIFISTDLAGKPKITPGDDCLAQMEQAMKAMDYFILNSYVKNETRWMAMMMPINKNTWKEYESARTQWENAKRDCWRTP